MSEAIKRGIKINERDKREAFRALSPVENIIFEVRNHLKQVPGALVLAARAISSFGKESSRQARIRNPDERDLKELAAPVIFLKSRS